MHCHNGKEETRGNGGKRRKTTPVSCAIIATGRLGHVCESLSIYHQNVLYVLADIDTICTRILSMVT